jgi:ABC-2 type transport system ATP-binding protein
VVDRAQGEVVVICIENLSKNYKGNVQALRNVSLEIPTTGMFGLLGVNGAGKTTLMRILATLLRPTTGTARVAGYNVADSREKWAVKAMLGYLPQELGLYPDLTAREFLDYIAILKRMHDSQRRREQVAQLLTTVGLGEAADRKLKTFSGGMKRRVGIAQALLNDPRLLIVDEPTSGLDPQERVRLRNLLADLARDRIVLLSTHIVEDIGQTCGDMAVLHQGRVLFRGAPGELIDRARGRVWQIKCRPEPGRGAVEGTTGEKPDDRLAVVSTLHLEDGTQYRVVGEDVGGYEARPVEPSLEDGYIWLMHFEKAGTGG